MIPNCPSCALSRAPSVRTDNIVAAPPWKPPHDVSRKSDEVGRAKAGARLSSSRKNLNLFSQVTLLSPYPLILSCLLRQSLVRAGPTTVILKHRSLPPQTQHPERRMDGIDERYLNVARQIRDRLSERHWSEVVDASRTMTMDCLSLDDVPAVALAFCRATMLSVSIESGSAFIREQMPA
jgi:hypothetical protein